MHEAGSIKQLCLSDNILKVGPVLEWYGR